MDHAAAAVSAGRLQLLPGGVALRRSERGGACNRRSWQPACRRSTASWSRPSARSTSRSRCCFRSWRSARSARRRRSGALRLLVQLPYRPRPSIAAKLAAVLRGLGSASRSGALGARDLACARRASGARRRSTSCSAICSTALLVGAIALFCGTHLGKRGDRRDRRARLHDRLVGARFHARRAARLARLAVALVADADAARRSSRGCCRSASCWASSPAICGFAALARRLAAARRAARAPSASLAACLRSRPPSIGLVGPDQDDRSTSPRIGATRSRRRSARACDAAASRSLVTVHLAPEDPALCRPAAQRARQARAGDAERLHSSRRRRPSVVGSATDDAYGEVEYVYGGRSGHQPLDQSARNPAAALRARRTCRRPGRRRATSIPAIRWSPTRARARSGSSAGCRC